MSNNNTSKLEKASVTVSSENVNRRHIRAKFYKENKVSSTLKLPSRRLTPGHVTSINWTPSIHVLIKIK